jgi:hypothetical protein
MWIFVWVALVILALVGILWWVNRKNRGAFRHPDFRAENQAETRRSWGPD